MGKGGIFDLWQIMEEVKLLQVLLHAKYGRTGEAAINVFASLKHFIHA